MSDFDDDFEAFLEAALEPAPALVPEPEPEQPLAPFSAPELSAESEATAAIAEQNRLAAESAQRVAAQKAEQARVAAQQAEQQRLAAAEAEQERLVAEEAEQERLAAEEAEQERLAAAEAEQARVAAEEAEQRRIALQKAEQERLAAAEAEQERLAAEEEAEQARVAAEEAEQRRIALQKAEQDRVAAQQAEQERLAAEEAEQARVAAEEAEQRRIALQQAEQDRVAAENTEQRIALQEAEHSGSKGVNAWLVPAPAPEPEPGAGPAELHEAQQCRGQPLELWESPEAVGDAQLIVTPHAMLTGVRYFGKDGVRAVRDERGELHITKRGDAGPSAAVPTRNARSASAATGMFRALGELVGTTVETARDVDQRYGLGFATALVEAKEGAQLIVSDARREAADLDERYKLLDSTHQAADKAKGGAAEAARKTGEMLRWVTGATRTDIASTTAPVARTPGPSTSTAAARRRQLAQVTPSVQAVMMGSGRNAQAPAATTSVEWPRGVVRAIFETPGSLGLGFNHSKDESDLRPATVQKVIDGSPGALLDPPVERGFVLVGVQNEVTANMRATDALDALRKHARERPLVLTFCAPDPEHQEPQQANNPHAGAIDRQSAAAATRVEADGATSRTTTTPRTHSAEVRAEMAQVKAKLQTTQAEDSPNKVIQLDEFLAARQQLMKAMSQEQVKPADDCADAGEVTVSGAG